MPKVNVHAVVDPAVLPLGISEPVLPLLTIGMAMVVLRRGAGAWSLDLGRRPPTPTVADHDHREAS